MFLSMILTFFICACLLGLFFAPFPYWPTYFRLWKCVLFEKGTFVSKRRQARFLLGAALRAPLWTAFWYLDELLFPQYRQREIKPVFIIGQPRCGTTFLHRTLARDGQNFFAMRHLEWRYPFICVHKLIALFGLEKRLGEASYWPKSDAGELAAKMHSNRLMDWEEDGIFFEENFLHHFFIYLRFPYPGLLPDIDAFPTLPADVQEKMLVAHRKALQKVAYLRGVQHPLYLSKEVTSHNKIPALLRLYPEARFIVVVRESSHFMPSLMALVRMSTWSKTGKDPLTLPGWHDSFVSRMREDSRRLVETCERTIPAERQLRVAAEDVIKRPSVSITTIYRALGLLVPGEVTAGLKDLDRGQATRDRGYQYDPFSPDGFDEYDAFVRKNNAQFRAKVVGRAEEALVE
ncbi:sulfotransferase [Thauera aromatica]|uniref:sulfotransferase n=1 Tax=Thauera aromatica TaxID=59405 RepID=UPI001FFDAB6A|nr:sulfotransferase [Thauera aromatica]MCK2094991.1 sulfotransferase [Thauera aromatica]